MKKEKKEEISLSQILLKECPICKKNVVVSEDVCNHCGYIFNDAIKNKKNEKTNNTIENNSENIDTLKQEKIDSSFLNKKKEEKKYTYGFFEKPDATVICKKCGSKVDATAKFCINCGEKIEKEFFCISCNKKIEEGMQFCPFCGIKQEKPLTKVEKLNAEYKEEIKEVKKTPVIKKEEREIDLERPVYKKNKNKLDPKKVLFSIIEMVLSLSFILMLLFTPFFIKNNLFDFINNDNKEMYVTGLDSIKCLFSNDINLIKNNLFENSTSINSLFLSYFVIISYILAFALLLYRIGYSIVNMVSKKEYRYFSLIIISIFFAFISLVSYISLLVLKIKQFDVSFIYIFIFEFIILIFINFMFNKKID